MIPIKLQTKEINFVLIEKSGKKPFQKNWQNKTIKYDDGELGEHLNSGGNYGVLGGGEKNLIIVDFDDEKIQEEIVKKLPETFTVQTGSGLLHKYFFSNKCDSFKIFNKEMDTLADVQGKGKQVVGAGSTHPNGSKYKIVEDKKINYLDYNELKAILEPYNKKKKKEKELPKIQTFDANILDEIKSSISIEDVLSEFGVDTSKNPSNCPFHFSKGGKCLGWNNQTIHCFHCDDSWNIFSWVMACRRCNFKDSLEYLAEKCNLSDKLKESRIEWAKKKKASRIFERKGQAEQFMENQPYFYDKSGMFWLWNYSMKYWEICDDIDILNFIEDETKKDIISSRNRTEILNSLKQNGRKNIPKDIKPTWIQFKDTIVDFSSGEEFKATPKYFVTNPIPWKLHKEKFVNTPVMDRIFEEWVGKDYVQTLYEILAYCLIPSYPIHRLFCMIGGGLNGKSCFFRLLKKFIGDNNVTATELDTLINSRFEITRLHKKLVCIMGETDFAEMSKTSVIKKLTGQDIIGFEYKNKTPFEGENYAKILIATNNLPTTTDKTIGFYRRWLIIDFPNRFSEKKDILSEIPDEEYEALTIKSINLLKDLLSKREFNKEGSIEDRERKYEEKSDPLEKFLKEITDLKNPNSNIPKWEFEKELNSWLIQNRYRKMTDKTIAKKMREKGVDDGRVYVDWCENDNLIKKQIRAWIGIEWLQDRKDGYDT